MRVNCSCSDPICTMNMAKSLNVILLMASSLRGRDAQPDLSRSANRCTFPGTYPSIDYTCGMKFKALKLCHILCGSPPVPISSRSQQAASNHLYAAVRFLLHTAPIDGNGKKS